MIEVNIFCFVWKSSGPILPAERERSSGPILPAERERERERGREGGKERERERERWKRGEGKDRVGEEIKGEDTNMTSL